MRNIKRWLPIVVLVWLLSGCSQGKQPLPATASPAPPRLNGLFADCYRPEYGPVISDTFQYQADQAVQFTANAVLRFDLKHPPVADKDCLLEVGLALDLLEPQALPLEGALYISTTGHNVHPLLKDAYVEHQALWGPPIAEARAEEFTILQYFSRLGVRLDWRTGHIDYLPYGAWMLARMDPGRLSQLALHSFPVPPDLRWLGTFPGMALLPENRLRESPVLPFSNLVLRVEGEGRLGLRPVNIVEWLVEQGKIVLPQETPPYDDLVPSPHPLYPAPVYGPLDRYIALHGGYDLIGYPLAPPHPFPSGIRQCFTNTCLAYIPTLPAGERVVPLAVGRYYWEGIADALMNGLVSTGGGVILRLAAPGRVAPGQEVSLQAYLSLWGEPAAGRVLQVTGQLNGQQLFAPLEVVTDKTGLARITLPPLSAKLGQTVEVRVCYAGLSESRPICQRTSLVVWDVP